VISSIKMSISQDIHSHSRSSDQSVLTNHYLSPTKSQESLTTGDGSSDAFSNASTEHESHSIPICHIFKLPNELLSHIVGLLYNEQLVSFAIACRRFHNLAGTALQEHRQLVSEWTMVSNVNKPPGYLASRVMRQIKDRRLRSYTYCLEIELGEPLLSFDNAGGALDPYILEALNDDVLPSGLQPSSPDYWELWKSDVKRSRLDAILWTWATLLESVTSLTLYLHGLRSNLLLELFDSSSELWPDSFDSLQRVRIEHSAIEGNPLSYRLLELSTQLTSVTDLSTAHIKLDEPTDHPISPPFVSNVESFTLEQCYLGTRHLVALISNMHSLDHFSHTELWPGSSWAPYTDRTAIVDCLKIAASQTLTSLELIGRAHTAAQQEPPLGSLEEFDFLQCVTLDFNALFRTLQEQPSKIQCTQLPRSIEWLKLVSNFGRLETESVKIMLRALLREKWERLPDLEDVVVVGIKKAELRSLRAARIVRRLETVGVEVTLRVYEDDADDKDDERDQDWLTDDGDDSEECAIQ